jgi:hypothetical protein
MTVLFRRGYLIAENEQKKTITTSKGDEEV